MSEEQLRQLLQNAEASGGVQIVLSHLFVMLQRVETQLSEHMENSKGSNDKINAELLIITSIVESMPHKEGKPDFYGHRVDHNTLRDSTSWWDSAKSRVRDKFIDISIIVIIILLANNKLDWLFKIITQSVGG